MQSKLHINVQQGILDVEGDSELVLRIYEDFKNRLAGPSEQPSASRASTAQQPKDEVTGDKTGTADTQRRPRRRRAGNSGDAAATKDYEPQLDKNLDTKNLERFIADLAPKNNAERILIFSRFLQEEHGLDTVTVDQIYTCYRHARAPIPQRFVQAIRDAHGKRYGFINFKTVTDVSITIAGINHYEQGKIAKKEAK